MEIYLVGGAVRDELLGLPVTERDWVVVGGSEAQMLSQGFLQVGKSFPVFLHPNTKEEYALARIERKKGEGYYGFDIDAAPTVTLEEDLARRDLTINAMAKNQQGEIIDPLGGQHDLKNRVLRHASKAFVEDPLRVLRVARFAARFHHLGFKVAPDTLNLMKEIVQSGELNTLFKERIFLELQKALSEPNPEQFFKVLDNCGALKILFPECIHNSLIFLENTSPEIQFALWVSDLTKESFQSLAKRLPLPKHWEALAKLVIENGKAYENLKNNDNEKMLFLLEKTDAFRREARFNQFLTVCEAKTKNKINETLKKALSIAKKVNIQAIVATTPHDKLKEAIHEARLKAIKRNDTLDGG